MKVSDYVVGYLESQNIRHGYFMIGGALGYLADACARKKFKLYTMHHEQSAGFAAEGQAAVTRHIGLALATSGPGATNLVTAIGSAFFDSRPVLFITGQVNTSESNVTGKRRQVGFQETEIVPIVSPITKYAVQVRKPARIAYALEKCVFLARNGRMGPTLLDLPLDVQKAEVDAQEMEHFIGSPEHQELTQKKPLDGKALSRVASLIRAAQRPMLLIGHGVCLSGAEKEVEHLARKCAIPMAATLLATDAIAHENPWYYGFLGTYGQRYTNLGLANADLIIVLGARMDSRQVGVQADRFAPGAQLVHVDIDPSELGASARHEDVSVCADVRLFLQQLLPLVPEIPIRKEWAAHLSYLKNTYPMAIQNPTGSGVSPHEVLEPMSALALPGAGVSVDVGSHQMWFSQCWKAKENQIIMTNGGMGPMGCALPTAIGLALSGKLPQVWVVAGDGGFQVNLQELQTVVRHRLPIKIVVFNNRALGMLTQFQTENFEGRLIGSVEKEGYDAPDFVKVAQAYGLAAQRVSKRDEIGVRLKWLAEQKGPALLDVLIPQDYWVLPKASYAYPVHDMKPFLSKDEMRKALPHVDEKHRVAHPSGPEKPRKISVE